MNKFKKYFFAKSPQQTDAANILHYHQYKIKQYSNQDYKALGWRDSESQFIRFEVLAGIANLNNCSVLDAGCGHADLKPYLDERYFSVTYYGLEQITDFLDVAIQRYSQRPQTHFIPGDFMTTTLPQVDYTLVNGSFNYHSSDPEFIFKAITRLYENSRLGLGFNLLSHITPNPNLVAYNADKILTFCSTLSKRVVFKDDYSDEDYTIFMYK